MSRISNTTNLNVRVDSTLKEESNMFFKNLGLNMSTAINMFLTKCVKTARIPFKIKEPKPSKELKLEEKYKNFILTDSKHIKIVVNVI